MGVYKEGKNWKVQVYYKDWQGNRKRKQKRGFRTKGEARNGKEISCNSRARVWILNLEIFPGDLLQRYGCPSQRKHYVHEAIYY